MRAVRAALIPAATLAVALAGGLGVATAPAMAQSQAPQPAARAADGCAGQPDRLGVSRVVEIDTKGGPMLGHQQYKDISFLEDGEIVLTFDDGPLRPYTQAVLKALAEECTRATFFVVGRMAVSDPEMVREMIRQGHTVGTHTWSHRNLRSIGPSKAVGEIELGFSAVKKAAGQPISPFFRFPYLSDPKGMIAHLKARDTGMFSIEVDAYDYRTRNPADVHRKVLGQLQGKRKGIILFHDIQPATAGALKGLLAELKARGFKVVHLIAKGEATTLAEYDAQAEKELSRKKLAALAQPLAPRSMVWPIASAPTSTLSIQSAAHTPASPPSARATLQPPPAAGAHAPAPASRKAAAAPVVQVPFPVAPPPAAQVAPAPERPRRTYVPDTPMDAIQRHFGN